MGSPVFPLSVDIVDSRSVSSETRKMLWFLFRFIGMSYKIVLPGYSPFFVEKIAGIVHGSGPVTGKSISS